MVRTAARYGRSEVTTAKIASQFCRSQRSEIRALFPAASEAEALVQGGILSWSTTL
jgi:hypothetical protein